MPTPQLWVPVLGFTLAAAGLFVMAGYRVADPQLGLKLGVFAVSAIVSFVAVRSMRSSRLAWAVLGITQIAAIAAGGMMLTYAAAALDMPLVDGALLRFDRAIGYRWIDYAGFVHARPWCRDLLAHGYELIIDLPFVIVFALAATRRFRQINRYLLAAAISLILTTAIFAVCPALTAWDYLGVDHRVVARFALLPDATSGWERDLLTIRAGHGFTLDRVKGSGLIAFPSYHCIAGLMPIWALWPLRAMRLPILVGGSLMVASAPIFGGHYVADLVGGAVVTLASVVAATGLEARWHATLERGASCGSALDAHRRDARAEVCAGVA